MSRVEIDIVREALVKRLRKFPLMNLSMMSGMFINYRKTLLHEALKELVSEGVILESKYMTYRQQTSIYYLAEEAHRLEHYINVELTTSPSLISKRFREANPAKE